MSRFWVVLMLVGCGHGEEFGSSERPPPSSLVGAVCDSDLECEQYCAREDEFPNGFCTVHLCRGTSDCPAGTVCISVDSGVCVYPCAEPLDCSADFLGRPGYSCQRAYGFNSEDAVNVSYRVCIGM